MGSGRQGSTPDRQPPRWTWAITELPKQRHSWRGTDHFWSSENRLHFFLDAANLAWTRLLSELAKLGTPRAKSDRG
jgi:hypothetical protein